VPASRTWPVPATALLLIGFVAALRRSELAALQVEDIEDHANGLVLTLPRSKTNQTGESTELVVLPRATNPDRCPVTALQRWMSLAGVVGGPVFRGVGKNRASPSALNPGSINALVQAAITRGHGPDLLLSSQPAHRFRHLRPPARCLRPGHRPPDPPPLPGHPGDLRARPTGLDRQRRDPAGTVTSRV
jgi:integrase